METHTYFRLKWDVDNDHRFEIIRTDKGGNEKGEPIPCNEATTLSEIRKALLEADKRERGSARLG